MSNDPVFREVDEELRRDRMRKLWRQGGPFVIAAAVLVVLGVAGYEGWTWYQKTGAAKSSDQFYAATALADGTDVTAAKAALDDVIAHSTGGYPALAQFREAALLSQNGKTDQAVAAYDGLATSLGNTHLRELALILAANLLIDKGDVAAVQQRVGGSMTPASPLRNAAREVLGLAQYKAGKLDDAMVNFQAIQDDPLSSRDLRSRIQIYMLQLVAEGAKPITPPDASSSAAVSSEASSEAVSASSASTAPSSAESSAPSSAASSAASDASTAVDSSTELDVTPGPVVDTSMLDLATPPASASSAAPQPSSSASVSSAPAVSSSAAPVASSSGEAPSSVSSASSEPLASSQPSLASSAPDASSSAP